MSIPQERPISPWWALLLLPIGLGVGVFVGGMPGPATRAPQAQEATGAPAADAPSAAPAVPATTRPAPSSTGWTSAPQRDPAPAPAPETRAPIEVPEAVTLSDWMSLESAMMDSKRTGKPIFIDFSADWCGPCQRLKREVFEVPARWQAVRAAVIPVSIVDRRRETGSNPPEIENLQDRFGADAFPTLIVFSPQSGRVVRTQGFGGGDGTVSWILQAAKSVK